MSVRMALPRSQQRHDNVAVVRWTRGRQRLEVACYKNKVLAFRSGAETSLEEVLQSHRVFSNVSRGEFASRIEIAAALGEGTTEREALERIVRDGALQVANHERTHTAGELLRDVCVTAAQRTIHPQTRRPYPAMFVEEMARRIGFQVRLDQPAKPQATALVRELVARQLVPVTRAPMRIRLAAAGDAAAAVLAGIDVTVEHHAPAPAASSVSPGSLLQSSPSVPGTPVGEPSTVFLADPEVFRQLSEAAARAGVGLVVVDAAVAETSEGDASAFIDELPPWAATQDPMAPPPAAPAPAPAEGKGKKAKAKAKAKAKGSDSDEGPACRHGGVRDLAAELGRLGVGSSDDDTPPARPRGKKKKK